MLLVEGLEAIFDRIFFSPRTTIILKISQEGERARKQEKGEKASGIYREVLSGKKSCPERRRAETVDKRSVKEQHVQERRPKEGQKRVRRVREKKSEEERRCTRGEEYASPWAMQPERRIIRIYLCTKLYWLALDDQESCSKGKEKRKHEISKTKVIRSPYFIY